MGANNHWSEDRWARLVERWCEDFGPEAAAKIIESSIAACGGERMTWPSLQDLQRRDRDRRICTYHRGSVEETALRFGVDGHTVRRALMKQKFIGRMENKTS